MTPNFGAIAQRRITILPAPLQSHIKTANQARAVIGRLEYALQHERRDDARPEQETDAIEGKRTESLHSLRLGDKSRPPDQGNDQQ